LIITDGQSDSQSLTKKAAENAKSAGIDTFAVGIGDASETELLNIANGDPKRVFKVDNFDELQQILNDLSA